MKRVIALGLLVLLCSTWTFSQRPQQGNAKPQGTQHESSGDQRGTEQAPFVIKVAPSPDAESKAAEDKQERKEKAESDWWLVRVTAVLALIGLLQLVVFGIQAKRLRESVEMAAKQSRDMETSIAEATRAANAMERVATAVAESAIAARDSVATMRERTAAQMRAYLAVSIGSAHYQDRANNIKFGALPVLLNTGLTPAYGVSWVCRAQVLPVPIHNSFDFPLPPIVDSEFTLAPHQSVTMGAVVEAYVDDATVPTIKRASGLALCVWGMVNYRDATGDEHSTKFCHIMTWLPSGETYGWHNPRHSTAD